MPITINDLFALKSAINRRINSQLPLPDGKREEFDCIGKFIDSFTMCDADAEKNLINLKSIIMTLLLGDKVNDVKIGYCKNRFSATLEDSIKKIVLGDEDLTGGIGENYVVLQSKAPGSIDDLQKIAADIGYKYVQASKTYDYTPEWLATKFKDDNGKLFIRVTKNVYFIYDKQILIFCEKNPLLSKPDEAEYFEKSLSAMTFLSKLTDKEKSDSETGALITELIDSLNKEVDTFEEDKLKKALFANREASAKSEADRVLERYMDAMRKCNSCYNDYVAANNNYMAAKYQSNELQEKIYGEFISFIKRYISDGKINRYWVTSTDESTEIHIRTNALPTLYMDLDQLKKCYKNLTDNAIRRKYIEKVIAGEAFFFVAPSDLTIKISTRDGSISHIFSQTDATNDANLYDPHMHYYDWQGCLGTFGDSVNDAKIHANYTKLLSVLMQFLQNITPNDGAGNLGVQYLPIGTPDGKIIYDNKLGELAGISYDEFLAKRKA